jgi:hypothetical protein
MYAFLRFFEWLFRKLALRIQYYRVIQNYNKRIIPFRKKNKSLFEAGHDRQMLMQFIKKWSVFKHPFSTEIFKIYSLTSGISSANFIPDNLFYWIIEPSLNRLRTSFAYADKNFYEKFYTPEFFPKGILHCINHSFYDSHYNLIKSLDQDLLKSLLADYRQIVIKPSTDSSGGRNIQFFTETDGTFVNPQNEILSSEYLNRIRNSDFVIQERIISHTFYARFNPTSLNAVRLMTYRSVVTEKIEVVCGILKVGAPGSNVDNLHAGGTVVAISKSGELSHFGVCGDGTLIHHLCADPDIELKDVGLAYNYDRMVDAATITASQVLNFRLISFDMCIDSTGSPRIIEINLSNQGTALYQVCRGPLLGDFTDEILEYCLVNKKIRNHVLL